MTDGVGRSRSRRVYGPERPPATERSHRRAGAVPVHARQLPRRLPRPACGPSASTRASAPPRSRTQRYRYLLEQGGTGLSVALDLPTQCGYDSDDPDVEEEVGRVGVAIDTLRDAEILFDGIPLDRDQHELHDQRHRRDPARVLRRGRREERRRPREAARHDPERHPQGVRRARHLDLAAEAVAAADRRHDRVLRGGGARASTRSRSPARTSATRARPRRRRWRSRWPTASPTATRWSARGRMTIDEFAPQVSFFFYTHGDFFEEVAKYRAGRRRWAHDRPRALRRPGRALVHVPLRLRLRRRVAVRAAGPEQHRARRIRGDGVGARRRAVDVHRRVGRAVRAPERGRRRRWRCARSRCSRTRPAWPASSTRSAARTTSRRSPTRWRSSIVEIMDDIERHGGMVRGVEDGYVQRLIADEAFAHAARGRRAGSARSSASTASTATSRRPSPRAMRWTRAARAASSSGSPR